MNSEMKKLTQLELKELRRKEYIAIVKKERELWENWVVNFLFKWRDDE